MRPLFLSVEGGEGSGKSTFVRALAEELRTLERKVTVTREPGGSAVAEKLRQVLLGADTDPGEMSVTTEALIVAAARSDHIAQTIRPALERGEIVISDRFIDSTWAYQGRDLDASTLQRLEQIACGGVFPDITLLLDASADQLLKRRQQRGQSDDRFEAQNLDFHNEIRSRFLRRAQSCPERIVVLDALQPTHALVSETKALLSKRELL